MDFATQESIRKLTENATLDNGIDATGLGVGVSQLVRSFYPAARDIRYTPEMRNRNGAQGKRRHPPWLSGI